MKLKKCIILGLSTCIFGSSLFSHLPVLASDYQNIPETNISYEPKAASVPAWVLKTLWYAIKYGVPAALGSIQLNNYTPKGGGIITTDSSHTWAQSLGSQCFNNKEYNIGPSIVYRTPIQTTWNQNRVKTTVSMNAKKKAFSGGSNYVALSKVTPNGTYYSLGRISSGSSLQDQITGVKNSGTFDFIYTYTDTAIWDLTIWFNDHYWPNGEVQPSPVFLENVPYVIDGNISDNVKKIIVDNKVYTMPIALYNHSVDKESINLKELIDQKTDKDSNIEVDSFLDYTVGDEIHFSDMIKTVSYNKERDVTFFQFESMEDPIYGLEFKGNLTTNYKSGDTLNLKFTVEKLGEYDDYVFETLNYLQDESFKEDSAPDINKYIE